MSEARQSSDDEFELLRKLVRGQVHRANNILTSLEFATATLISSAARAPVRELIQELVGELNHLRSAALAGPQDISFTEALTIAQRLASNSSQAPEVVLALSHVFSHGRSDLLIPFLCDLILRPGAPAVRKVEVTSDMSGQLSFCYQVAEDAAIESSELAEELEALRLWGARLGLALTRLGSAGEGLRLGLEPAETTKRAGKEAGSRKGRRSTKGSKRPKAGVHRLLVIEDDATLRRFFAAALRASGLEVEVAASGAEALAKLQSFQAEAALVDLNLGKEGGVEVARELNKQRTLPVLFMSGEVDVSASELEDLPLVGILSKPLTASSVLQALANYF